MAKCPSHADGSPSLSIGEGKTGIILKCFAGCSVESVCSALGLRVGDLFYESKSTLPAPAWTPIASTETPDDVPADKPTIETIYPYHNELGVEVFQVVRLKPKSFRQRHPDGKGGWTWNMDGVTRVLYRLPEILKAQTVALCEGEKDADTLTALGLCGTCNVGGAGKWLDGYTESLAGKDVLIFQDNDDAGAKHAALVFESIAGKAKTVKLLKVPSMFKDVTAYVEGLPTETRRAKLDELITDAHAFIQGVSVPIRSMAEIEPAYERQVAAAAQECLDLSKWLPSFRWNVRPLVAGELALIVGDTGTGKTGLLQSIALAAAPLPTLMFEVELPAPLLFERFIAAKLGTTAKEVEDEYARGQTVGPAALAINFKNLFICDESRLTTEKMESIIHKSELKMGLRPKLVLVDYVQLLQGSGESRYDRASNVAEDLKRIAKSTGVIIIAASQRGRPKEGEVEVSLHSAKESGSLENSAGLVIGCWRDAEDSGLLHLKVLKNTKGQGGFSIACNFDGARMKITERSRPTIDDSDVPKTNKRPCKE